jgi:hypothetical protein
MKTTKPLESSPATVGSFTEIKKISELTDEFVASEKQRKKEFLDEAGNSYLATFCHIAQFIVANYENQSFSYFDFENHSKHMDVPIEGQQELKRLYSAWLKTLEAGKRVKTIEGCYNEKVQMFL